MSAVGDIRRAIEAMQTYDCTEMWGCATMEPYKDGDWIRKSDVLAFFPPAPQIVYHDTPPKVATEGGYSHPKVTPKLK